ncbi:putative ester cyclase [Azospirillum lipoferum]|uniref:Ester cyclase n=1 Tax=Azospirillum lipoferum TaxID=193 RepID=A0A5A9GIU6_AZOLI|nr:MULTISPECIES: ester cyclase [Azospirillum]KAA0594370.1 ester cyclase [Azospirillum lipoferum]MCP1613104.1 putative ester cyclase [Azospirillum lipoferum]MDW5531304.1 ester cyclase [Azospirillum sp. NL1]
MHVAVQKFARAALFAAVLGAIPAGSALAADGVTIRELIIATPQPEARSGAAVKAARAFYEFWNSGDTAHLKQAISDRFTDRTLPAGRPQGPEGPAFASRSFRTAVPDLGLTVEKMIVAGDYVTVHMVFTGHFSGKFGDMSGKGQPIRFIATDLLKVEDGQITDNWHIEDNLPLFQQMGLAKVGP